MRPKSFMVIAGEASGDMLAAELVGALREELADLEAVPTTDYQPLHASLEPRFFGAGGPCMAAAGVSLAFDMTEHSVVGLSDVLRNYLKFRRLFRQLYRIALEREPDAIICVDFAGFNRRFAHAIRAYTRSHLDWFHDWSPRIIQYISPQVWASRESRARQMARDYDLLLSIFPFEKDWYAQRVPQFPVEFVGHPMLDRFGAPPGACDASIRPVSSSPLVLLLPGSRTRELTRHLPVMIEALTGLRAKVPSLRARLVLPTKAFMEQARAFGLPQYLEVQAGELGSSLAEADLALASTGTVTMECAYFGVPTVAMYKTSWSTYQIAKRIVRVKYLAMPNLLANEVVFPEFIQHDAGPENVTRAALDLLRDQGRRAKVKAKLCEIIASLGGPGATRRAARAIARVVGSDVASASGAPALTSS